LPGYIITLKGDTIKGLINYKNWERSPERISFINQQTKESYLFNSLQIKEFQVKDEIYVGTAVDAEVSVTYANGIDNSSSLNIASVPAFLQTLVRGPKSLYSFVNRNGKQQFYIKKDSVYELLMYNKYQTVNNQVNVIAENKMYYGQLSLYLQDCPGISRKLETTEYNSQSLKSLFLYYYESKNEAITFNKEIEKVKVDFVALAGISLTSLYFTGINHESIIATDFNRSTNFTGGISFDLHQPRNNGKWSLI